MDRFDDMAVFVAVAEAAGFAAAARRLNRSAPSVTRAIANLEASLGALLITRNTRSLHLTESGQHYYADCKRILAEVEDAMETAAGVDAPPRGTLSITAPVLFGELFVTPIVVQFLQQHPAVSLRAMFVDRVVDLADEGLDVAIRIGALPDSGLPAIRVGCVRRVVCATPAYLKRHGTPSHPRDLQQHQLIDSLTIGAWNFRDGDQVFTLNPQAALTIDANQIAIAAAVNDFGITRVMSYQISNQLASGELETVLSEFEFAAVPVHVVYMQLHKIMYAHERQASTKVQHFVKFMVEKLRTQITQC